MAGATGSRLHPIALGTSEQLVPVYDTPMVYDPLTTIVAAGGGFGDADLDRAAEEPDLPFIRIPIDKSKALHVA